MSLSVIPLSPIPSTTSAEDFILIHHTPILVRHHIHYYDTGDLFITVRGLLFCVHEVIFYSHSSLFQRTIGQTTEDDIRPKGLLAERPLAFHNIPLPSFTLFLDFVYSPMATCGIRSQWETIRDVAKELEFTDAETIAAFQVFRYVEAEFNLRVGQGKTPYERHRQEEQRMFRFRHLTSDATRATRRLNRTINGVNGS